MYGIITFLCTQKECVLEGKDHGKDHAQIVTKICITMSFDLCLGDHLVSSHVYTHHNHLCHILYSIWQDFTAGGAI